MIFWTVDPSLVTAGVQNQELCVMTRELRQVAVKSYVLFCSGTRVGRVGRSDAGCLLLLGGGHVVVI